MLSILPAQDVLGLGSEARMNRPGTSDGNWRWRLEEGALTAALAARLREATERSGRLAPSATRSEGEHGASTCGASKRQGQARPSGTRVR